MSLSPLLISSAVWRSRLVSADIAASPSASEAASNSVVELTAAAAIDDDLLDELANELCSFPRWVVGHFEL